LLVRLFGPSPNPQSVTLPLSGQKVYRSNPLEDKLEELTEVLFAPGETITVWAD